MIKLRFLFSFLFLFSAYVSAQGLPDNGSGGADPDVPVDGGIVTILGGAIYFGIKQLRKKEDGDNSAE
ncbi:MAG: hypothetical protein LW772_07320 [Bacteroidetes bacterium]|jgi:hypothetical protein|nr:hypothetical protein [Bacteroidota bacterium]